MRTMAMGAVVALAVAVAACDGSTTAPSGGEARMRAEVSGTDAGGAMERSSGTASDSSVRESTGQAQGDVQVTARVYVWSSESGWVELTNGPQQATVDAAGSGSAQLLGSAQVAAGSYTRARVEFDRVQARLSGGLQVSTGLLDGSVAVDLGGDGRVVVEKQIAVNASAEATTTLDVVLNTSAWLSQADAQTRTVAESSFADAVTVSAR